MLGWKTCAGKYYYETDELPQPKAKSTQEKKNGEKWHLGFPTAK